MSIASTYVTIRPDTDGFRSETDAELRKALADAGVEVKVGADTSGAVRSADLLKAKLAELSKRITANVDVADKPAQAKLLALQAQLLDIGKKVVSPKLDLSGVAGAQAALAALDVDLDRLDAKTVQPEIRVNVNQAKIDALRASLDQIGQRVATASVDVDDKQATAKLLSIRAKLEDLGAKTANPNIDIGGIAHAEADLAGLDAELDAFGSKTVTARANVDTSGGLSAIGALTGAIAALGPSLLPIGAGLTAGIGGLGGAIAGAGLGAGGIASVAIPAITNVKKALTEQTAAQKAATTAAGTGAASQVSSANAIKSAQISLADAQRNAANSAISSAEAVKNAQQGLTDAERKQANDQISSSEAVANARQTLSDAVKQQSYDQQSSLRTVAAAEQALGQAQQQEVQAQQAITAARVAAKQALQDLSNNLADARLSAQQDALNLESAQQQLQATMANPQSTQLQREQAQLTAKQAQQSLVEQQLQVSRLTDQNKQATKAGVEGSAQVVAAKQAEQQADAEVVSKTQAVADAKTAAARQQAADAEAVTKAQQGVADAQRTASQTAQADAEAIAKAQQSIGDAVRAQANQQAQSASAIQSAQLGVQNAYNSAATAASNAGGAGSAAAKTLAATMAVLTPSERNLFDAFQTFKGAYSDFVKQQEPNVIPVLTGGLDDLQAGFKVLGPIIKPASDAVATLETDGRKALTQPFWKDFFGYIAGTAHQSIIDLGTDAGRVFGGIAGLVEAFDPERQAVLAGLTDISTQFENFGQDAAAGKSKPFNQFQDFVRDTGPQVKTTLGDVETLLGHIITGLAPSASPSLKLVSDLAKDLEPIVAALKKYLPGAIDDVDGLAKKLEPLLTALSGPFTKGVADDISGVAGALGAIATQVDKLPPDVLDAIGTGLGIIVGAVAISKLTGLSRFTGYLGDLSTTVGTGKTGLASKLGGVAGPIDTIGTKAGGASGQVSGLRGALAGLSNLVLPAAIGGQIGYQIGKSSPVQQAARDYENFRTGLEKVPVIGPVVEQFNKVDGAISDIIGNTSKVPGTAHAASEALFTLPSGKVITITGKDAVTKFSKVVKDNVDGTLTPSSLKILGIDRATAVANGVKVTADNIGKLTPTVHLDADDRDALDAMSKVGNVAGQVGKLTPDIKVGVNDRATDTMNKISQRAANLGQKNPDIQIDAHDAASKVMAGVTGGLGRLRDSIISVKDHLKDLADRAFKVEVDATGKWSSAGKTAIPGHADGGLIRGPGGPKSDSVLMFGSDGEFMQNADAVAREGVPAMQALNAGKATIVPRFAAGGFVNVGGTSYLSPINRGTDKFLSSNIDEWVKDSLDKQLASSSGPGGKVNYHPSAGVAQWANTVKHVLDLLHQPLSLTNDVLALIAFESAGNPNAVNLSDINARNGTPSVGLAQVIGPTFRSNAGQFLHTGPFAYGVSEDPTANVYAGMHYGIKTYGGIANIPGIQSVNRGGGYKPYATGGEADAGTWGLAGEAGPEFIHFRGPATIYNNAQSQAMAPHLGAVPGFASGGTVGSPKITGTTFTNTKLFEQAGQHILDVILSSFRGSRAQSTIDMATQSLIASIDKDFTGSRRTGLVDWTKTVNSQLDRLATERNSIAAKITAANATAAGLTDAGNAFAAITNLGGTADAGGILTALQTKLAYIKDFGANLTKLSKLGFSKQLIGQIVAAGPDQGGALAQQLAQATSGQASQINKAETSIGAATTQLGTTGVNAQYGGNPARGFVGGLQAQEKNLEKQMNQLAAVFAKGVGKAFHLKGYAAGGNLTAGQVALVGEQGPELIRSNTAATVYTNAQTRAMGGGIDYDRLERIFAKATGGRTAPIIGSAVFEDNTDVEATLRRAAFIAQATGLSA